MGLSAGCGGLCGAFGLEEGGRGRAEMYAPFPECQRKRWDALSKSCCWEMEKGLAMFWKWTEDGTGQGRTRLGARRWLFVGSGWAGATAACSRAQLLSEENEFHCLCTAKDSLYRATLVWVRLHRFGEGEIKTVVLWSAQPSLDYKLA